MIDFSREKKYYERQIKFIDLIMQCDKLHNFYAEAIRQKIDIEKSRKRFRKYSDIKSFLITRKLLIKY